MLEILLIIILIVLVIFSLIFSFNVFILPFTKGVPYVPLKNSQVQSIFKELDLSKDAKVVDLGCGDARVLRLFEKNGFTDLVGYEINPWPYLIGIIKNLFLKSKVKIVFRNFENVDLGEYDIIFCYLLKSYLKKLRFKFDKELKPGAKIISYAFEIEGWQPKKVLSSNKKRGKICIYQI